MREEEILRRWLEQENLDQILREELTILKDENEIYDRFYKDLEFGTGGLRGILGAGTNRMNIYTVRRSTQGFADYIKLHYGKGGAKYQGQIPTVAIAYDSRNNSKLFAQEAALVLAANGIKSYMYNELMPTPALSFAVRYYKCCGGIMVTASHNPPLYNGYKVYNEEGCQITLDTAAEILELINRIDMFHDGKTTDVNLNLIEAIPPEVTDVYLEAVRNQSTGAVGCQDLSVVFTPLNGTGNIPVRRILDMIGVKDVTIVKEQELPDGNFPTCPYPNPEKKEALELGLALCKSLTKTPDLLLATDPDCDRVGIAIKHKDKIVGVEDFHLLSGNEVGILLIDFLCQRRLAIPENPIIIKTIVSSKMADEVAKGYGVEMINVLPGFKFIGEQIGLLEVKKEESRFLFGFEESYGYLSGTYVRDKDAVNASMLICEMVAYYKQEGKTLIDVLEALYSKYGYYKNELIDYAFEGAAGIEKMYDIMLGLRTSAIKTIIGKKVVQIADYLTSQRRILGGTNSCSLAVGMRPIHLPKSDIIEYILEDGSCFIIRPSGTEPKLKIYISAKGEDREESEEIISELKNEMKTLLLLSSET